MRQAQKVILVADELSLMNAYSVATLKNFKATPTQLGLVAVGAALVPTMLIGASTVIATGSVGSFFSKRKVPIPKVDRETILATIQQTLGLGATVDHVLLNEANSISLGMGQIPRNNCFYISHPIKDDLYIPLQDYNDVLAKEKNNVFMELAAALGAKSIHLENARFYNTKGKVDTDFSVLKPVSMGIGINANFEKGGSIKKEVYSSFDKRTKAPMVPKKLQKWVDIDSDLDSMVTNRLNNGLRSHQISLTFNDTLDGAAEVAAKMTGMNKGASLKASASKHISSTWVFRVEYHSMDDE